MREDFCSSAARGPLVALHKQLTGRDGRPAGQVQVGGLGVQSARTTTTTTASTMKNAAT